MSYFTKSTRILVIDTETANTHDTAKGADMTDVLVYDCGFVVCDIEGNVYETASYINRDIFFKESDLMQTAYYAAKIPQYLEGIAKGKYKVANLWEIREASFNLIKKYNIKFLAAYNARFDANALNRTIQWVSKSFCRYFYQFGQIEWLDIMKMAQDTIITTRNYKQWAIDNDYLTKNGLPRKTAEMVYQYMTGEQNFEEEHTGLEDALIEVQIMAFCFSERNRRKVKMRTLLYEKPLETCPPTDFQRNLSHNLKICPVLQWVRE